MENHTWTYLSALGSVAFGWLLNETGQWLKGRKDDKKIKKTVLYNLLETYHIFKRLDNADIINQITEIVFKKIPKGEQTEELKKNLFTYYNLTLQELNEDHIAEELNNLENSFTKSVDDLSKVDPIRAYRLKGKTRIINVFDWLDDYFENLKNNFPADAIEIENATDKLIDKIRPEIITGAIKDLEEEIKKISLNISLITRYKANKIIRIHNKPAREEDKAKVEVFLNNYLAINSSNIVI
jgi:hypothetical protein